MGGGERGNKSLELFDVSYIINTLFLIYLLLSYLIGEHMAINIDKLKMMVMCKLNAYTEKINHVKLAEIGLKITELLC